MGPIWAGWKARAGRWAAGAGLWAWGLVLGLLGAALVAQGGRGRGEAAELAARSAALERDLAEMRRRNQALRDEIRALETDPVYVEALLRRWKRVEPGERLVE
jgi:cell division protein FtsB